MNILITSVGRRYYLVKYFKEALLRYSGKLYVCNSTSYTSAFAYADEAFVSPLIYDDNYIDFLIKLVKEKNISAIISLFDADLPVLALNKKVFNDLGVNVLVSSMDIIEICNDKWRTFEFLMENNFSVPKSFLKLSDLFYEIELNKINYPIIIKPRWGCGSIGVFEAYNKQDALFLSKYIVELIKKSYLKYEAAKDMEKCLIYQEKVNGIEYGLDIINDLKTSYCNTIVKEKYALRSGETDIARVMLNDELEMLGKKISYALKHIGNLDIDLIKKDNSYYVLDMNNRFGGGYPFSHAAGVNLPQAIVNWLNGDKSLQLDLLSIKKELLLCKDIIVSDIM